MRKLVLYSLLVISFLGMGFASKSDGTVQDLNKIVAVVNNQIITQSALNQQIAMVKHQLQLENQPIPSRLELKKKVLNQMINEQLILQIAKAHQFQVTDKDLNEAIAHVAKQNHLTVKQLQQQVQKQGLNYQDYKTRLRKQLLLNAVERKAIGNKVHVTKAEVDAKMQEVAAQVQNIPEYNLEAMLIPVPEAPTPDVLQSAQNKANSIIKQLQQGGSFSEIALTETFDNQPLQGGKMGWRRLSQLPPVMAGELAGSVKGSIVGPIQTPNGFYIIKVLGTRTLNATHKVALTKLRIILLKIPFTESSQQVENKIKKIRKEIIKGASFAKMAKKYSQQSKSASKGGDLGWVAADELPTKLAKAVQKLHKGKISQPIQTKDGWQIVQVEGRKTVDNSEANLRNRIKQMIYVQKFESAVKVWVKKLRGNAYIQINS